MDAGRIDVVAEAAQVANALAGQSEAAAGVPVPAALTGLAPGIFGGIAPAHGVHGTILSAKNGDLSGYAAGVDEGSGEAVVAYVVGNADNEQALSSVTEG